MYNKYLQRKSYQVRYIRGVIANQLALMDKGDKQLINSLRDFMDDAGPKDINALLRNNNRNKLYYEFSQTIDEILKSQEVLLTAALTLEIKSYIDSEIDFTHKIFDADKPSLKTDDIAKQVVSGLTITQTLKNAQSRIAERIRKQIATAVQGGDDPSIMLKGSRAQKFKDGVFFWRNNRIYKTNIDQLINGMGWNARKETINNIDTETKIRWLGTLDGRMCRICAANEVNSPYAIDKVPLFPPHPNCRCDLVPDIVLIGSRPFVKSFKPVSKIPTKDRKGLIGQVSGKTNYGEWFANQDKQFQRRWLGKTFFEEYQTGKYKLTDFVDPLRSKVYTIEQFNALN